MLRLIETVYSYDAWATDRLLDSMETLTEEEYGALVAGRHGSIRNTFAHLMLDEWRIFSWLDGSLSLADASRLRLDGGDIGSIAAARYRWHVIKEQAAWVISSLSDAALAADHRGTLPDGSHVVLPLWTVLLHVANQNTQTRGQIISAMQQAGHAVEGADLFRYALDMQIRGNAVFA